jgi:tetratricopeptide (TPR) repeat protein
VGDDQIREFVGPGPLNTDDNALIEFSAPKDLLTYATIDPRLPFLDAIDGKRFELAPRYFSGFSFDGESLHRIGYRLLEQGRLEDGQVFLEKAKEQGAEVERSLRIAGYMREDDDQPVVIATEETKTDERYARSAYAMMNGDDKDALALFEMHDKLEEESLAHRFLYAFLCYRMGRFEDAEYLMEKVLADPEFGKRFPPVLYYAGKIALYRDHYEESVEYFRRFDEVEEEAKARVMSAPE